MSIKRQQKILIVDDVDKNLQVVGNILGEKGLTISLAKSGKQAIKIAKRILPDLILLDINMPELNGYETCEILKNDKETSNIPIIFLSALNEKEDIVKGFDYGAVDYITKPFNKAELLSRVFTHLELQFSRKKLIEKNEELKELNATKDKFVSIISHDLKSPFNAILGFSRMLLKNFEKYDEEKREKLINSVNNSANRAFKLLENLLEWSRLQTGKIEVKPTKVKPSCLIYEVVLFCDPIAANKEIKVESEINYDDFIFVDKEMIKTTLRNLVTNAIKFSFKGRTVILKTKKENNNIIFMVSDTGTGIEAEYINKLFKIDSKLSKTGTANETGTGLGLILCHEFVEKHGGKIWAESEIGKGSTFSFSIPVEEV